MSTFWVSEVNIEILEQENVAKWNYGYMLQFLKKLKLCTQTRSRNSALY